MVDDIDAGDDNDYNDGNTVRNDDDDGARSDESVLK